MQQLTAKDIMSSPVVSVGANDKLTQVERLLVKANLNGAPVLENGNIVGMISRSDFVRVPILLESLDSYISDELSGYPLSEGEATVPFSERFSDMVARDIMTTQVQDCETDTPVKEIASRMVIHRVHRLVVMEKGLPVGIIESLDLVKLLTGTTAE